MIALGNLLIAISKALDMVITFYLFVLIARCVLSFVSPDPRNPIVQFIYGATEPVLSRVRAKIPPMGMFDLSVLVVMIALYFVQWFFVTSLMEYGMQFKGEVAGVMLH